jgi:hypothetical protein
LEYNIEVSEFISDALFQFPNKNLRGGLTIHEGKGPGRLEPDKDIIARFNSLGVLYDPNEILDVLVPVGKVDGEDIMSMDSPLSQKVMSLGRLIVKNEPLYPLNLS